MEFLTVNGFRQYRPIPDAGIVDNITEGDFGIMWYEAVDLYGRCEWIYEENQAYPAGFDNKAIPALLEWNRDRFAKLS